MDLATLLGLIGAFATVLAATFFGGDAITFVNIASLLIVLAGTTLVVLMKFNLKQYPGAFKVAKRAFFNKLEKPEELIPVMVDLSKTARKEGLIALDGYEVENEFLDSGIKMPADGHDAEVVKTVMIKELQ